MKHEQLLALASRYAQYSTMYYRHGCVAVVHGKPIAYGFNHQRNYSKDKIISNCCCCHAEVAAIRNAFKYKHKFKRMSLYIVRLTKTNHMIDSRPCHHCYLQMMKHGIRRIIYSMTPTTYTCIKVSDYVPNKLSEGDEYYRSL